MVLLNASEGNMGGGVPPVVSLIEVCMLLSPREENFDYFVHLWEQHRVTLYGETSVSLHSVGCFVLSHAMCEKGFIIIGT